MFVNFVACVPVAAAGALVALGANSSNPRMATTTAVAIDDDALRNLPMRPCLLVRRGQWIGVGRMGPAGSLPRLLPDTSGHKRLLRNGSENPLEAEQARPFAVEQQVVERPLRHDPVQVP